MFHVVLPLISEEERPEIVPRIPEDMPPEPRSISIVFAIVPEQGDVDRYEKYTFYKDNDGFYNYESQQAVIQI